MARSSRLHRCPGFLGFSALSLAGLGLAAGNAGCGGDSGDGRARSAPASAAAAGEETGADPAGPVAPVAVRQELAGSVRLILFAGQPVAAARTPSARGASATAPPVTVDPPLPRGLSLDPATGQIRGAAAAPAAGRAHVLRDARGATSTAWIEVLPSPVPATSRFAAPSGDDANPGTVDRPFRTVGRAVRDLGPGATLFLRGGVYRESVELRRLAGTEAQPIQIRSYPGEHAVIDASEAIFAESPDKAWRKATGPGAHPDEWISTRSYSVAGKDSSSRGAFLDRPRYTRLLTYSRLEDLRADNQTWTSMPKTGRAKADRADEADQADQADQEGGADRAASAAEDPAGDDDDDDAAVVRPGKAGKARKAGKAGNAGKAGKVRRGEAAVASSDPRPGPTTLAGKKRRSQPVRVPWTYFGPGIHFDRATGHIHIRLSPTSHGVAGLEEYRGQRDPRRLPLAISSRADRALSVFGSEHLRIADVGLYHGGDETVRIQGSADVVLDHVEIRAATYGLFLGEDRGVRVLHSVLDGGIPPWTFRSDFKGVYKFADPSGEVVTNNLVRKTQRALLFLAGGNADVEIAHCELTDAHDVYLAGARTDFHHNHLRNIHDESLYLKSTEGETGMRIHDNVVEQTLSALSFWGKGRGARYVYRNLFDLRLPTAGHRPTGGPGDDPWRYGHPFKNTGNTGALYFYQNTVLVSRPTKTPFLQFSAFGKDPGAIQRRWFLNNVFAVVAPDESGGRAVAFLPPPEYQALRGPGGLPLLRSDGNVWARSGGRDRPLFRCTENNHGPSCGALKKVWKLADARGAAGFEANSREVDDPGFRRAARLDRPDPTDDLRPGKNSPALGRGVALPADLPDPARPKGQAARPDAGAFAAGQPLLRVGVDGRLAY